ncbi:hypothetical protein CDD80_440 [Ophiocordyceps camponoti-rufipedis]|uniref:Uncharacterized protein n=1 Tax=Ophiocordyceps camponoti-rufipedis TaxID=2004952 RepID=A0A2C5ZCL7_9HYPO|nr:hypothetical protein CDD80_440 [Ophiocordyceps camponoti-rufipedis]
MRLASILASAGLVAAGSNNYLGFNSGATKADYSAKFKADFEAEFRTAQGLQGAPGKFNCVRLYTNIQAYSQNEPIQAFDAAVSTQTRVLLGIWTSGTSSIDKELAALQTAVKTLGKKFTDLVIGISIGSEDLYRNSQTGDKNKAGVGASVETIVGFINQFRREFANGPLAKVPVGHVDTWDAWTNATNRPVIDKIDWLGVDEYPSYQSGEGNSIENAARLFEEAFRKTVGVAGGKPVWVTETGWPLSGPDWDQAKASVDNSQRFWREVGCRKLFNKVPTFWYNLRDSNPANKLKFAITKDLSVKPAFDLSCPAKITSASEMSSDNRTISADTDSTSTVAASKTSDVGPTASAASAASHNDQTSASPSSSGATGQRISGTVYAGLLVAVAAVMVLS